MINFQQTRIRRAVLFDFGDSSGPGYRMHVLPAGTKEILDPLLRGFISPFKGSSLFHLTHDGSLSDNPVFLLGRSVFQDSENLIKQGNIMADLLQSLYESPEHCKGYLFVIHLEGLIMEEKQSDGLGIFRIEEPDTFLKVMPAGETSEIRTEQGINIQKVDRGCIILNIEQDLGYIVTVADTIARKAGTVPWKDGLLKLRPRNDAFNHTAAVITLCKKFVSEKLPAHVDVSKADQADLLNRSVQYMKSHEQFDLDDYSGEVLPSPEVARIFKDFTREDPNPTAGEIPESFQISGEAIRKNLKYLRSVIKLDKNFHVYIHGSRDRVEKGYDEMKALQYYKLFFKEEQ